MLDTKTVEECMENAKTTLRHLSKKKEERIAISRKLVMGYCNDSIMLYEMILVLLKGKK